VTGASGAGKTAAVRSLEKRAHAHVRCHYFDTIGVPSLATMQLEFGGPEAWQLDATRRWITRLAHSTERKVVHVLDGQTRPSFVVEAARDAPAAAIRMVLLDASPTVRKARVALRGQPELATEAMDRWASHLLGEADALHIPVINNDALTVEDVVDALELLLEAALAAAHPAVAGGRGPRLRLEPRR